MATHAKFVLIFVMALLSISGNEALRHLTEKADLPDYVPTTTNAPPTAAPPANTFPLIQGGVPNEVQNTGSSQQESPANASQRPKKPSLPKEVENIPSSQQESPANASQRQKKPSLPKKVENIPPSQQESPANASQRQKKPSLPKNVENIPSSQQESPANASQRQKKPSLPKETENIPSSQVAFATAAFRPKKPFLP